MTEPLIIGLFLALIVIAVLALGTERVTEVLKIVRNAIQNLPLAIFDNVPTGPRSSWILALLVAASGVFGLGNFITPFIPGISQVDPNIVKFLGTLLVWAASSLVHDKIPSPPI